uniref:Transposase n=3 Tax=Oryza sativa subsp. japonica TaxID=39947 RepID=A0A5S6RAC2_ORYSJ|nr:Putative transposase [Oryza sativa Japonica Group]AAM47612.1 Putative transposase [Oryza sativa Japonica Group]ABB46678.2 transposon protein, putative, CACTA, En/Spm sub-class [Oryza sativa Japonica Group]
MAMIIRSRKRTRGSRREDTIHMCIEEQVAMFLHTVGHNLRNRLVRTNYGRSGETDCIGAIDGTHIRASVRKNVESSFRGRKSHATQNVMAAVDFDLRFTYVLAGWEGTAHDAVVLRDALERENGLHVPQGKFYLVDGGYGAKQGFLPPFRAVRYHLKEWGNNPVQNEKELFNLRHSSLRITVERAFGSLKRRFKVLDDATPFFPFRTQVDIVVACCIIHNWVINDGIDELVAPSDWSSEDIDESPTWQANDHALMEMDNNSGKGGSTHASWTSAMSSFMLSHLANVVAGGTRTSSGFKAVHLNACARAVNERFNSTLTGEQIKNHLKTWQRKFSKINRLRKVSAAGWDEKNFIITLDDEHYNGYIEDHKADANYFNKPLAHYGEMLTIFGSTMATGKYAKDSSSVLGTEDVQDDNDEENDGPATTDDRAEASSASKPKKAKTQENEDDGLIGAFTSVGDKLASAILKVAEPDNKLPEGLFDTLKTLPGFEEVHRSFYYAHLVANPHIARAFDGLPFENKMHWFAMFISEKFPGST